MLLNPEFPYVDIQERVKNKSFVAKKAVTFSEEQNVLTKAPVTKVKIDNISKKENKKWIKEEKIFNYYRCILFSGLCRQPS